MIPKLESIAGLARRFSLCPATIIRRLRDIKPDRTETRRNGAAARFYDPSKVEQHLAKRDRALSELETAFMTTRIVKLRAMNEVHAGTLLSVVKVRANAQQHGQSLRGWLNQHLVAQGPALLAGVELKTAVRYGREAVSRIEAYFDAEVRPWRNGPDRRPDLDMQEIITPPPLPPSKTPRDALLTERIRKLQTVNSNTARAHIVRVDYVATAQKVRLASIKEIEPLLSEEYPRKVIGMDVSGARAYSITVHDQTVAILHSVAVRLWNL